MEILKRYFLRNNCDLGLHFTLNLYNLRSSDTGGFLFLVNGANFVSVYLIILTFTLELPSFLFSPAVSMQPCQCLLVLKTQISNLLLRKMMLCVFLLLLPAFLSHLVL